MSLFLPSLCYCLWWWCCLVVEVQVLPLWVIFTAWEPSKTLEDPYSYLNSSWNFNNNIYQGIHLQVHWCGMLAPGWEQSIKHPSFKHRSQGQFPDGIENCSSLTGLDLSNNKLSGPIPGLWHPLISHTTVCQVRSHWVLQIVLTWMYLNSTTTS